MTQTIAYSGYLVSIRCWCGITHAVPSDLRDYQLRMHNDGRKVPDIYCPLGHTHVPAGVPEHERVARALELERQRSGRLAAERDQAKASARAQKGVATRVKRRAAAGLCPCCNRTVKQLAEHMKTKHPTFDPSA